VALNLWEIRVKIITDGSGTLGTAAAALSDNLVHCGSTTQQLAVTFNLSAIAHDSMTFSPLLDCKPANSKNNK